MSEKNRAVCTMGITIAAEIDLNDPMKVKVVVTHIQDHTFGFVFSDNVTFEEEVKQAIYRKMMRSGAEFVITGVNRVDAAADEAKAANELAMFPGTGKASA